MRNLELPGHVTAGRKARNRGLLDVRTKRRESFSAEGCWQPREEREN